MMVMMIFILIFMMTDYDDYYLSKGIDMISHTYVTHPSPKHHILSKMSLTVSQVCIPLSQYILNQGASME